MASLDISSPHVTPLIRRLLSDVCHAGICDLSDSQKVVREWELSEPYLIRDISEDGLDDSNRTGGQARSDSIASQLSCSLRSRTSVIEPPEGLHPVLLTGIMVNYKSSGYILLRWGELRPSSIPSTTVHGPSASHHSLFFRSAFAQGGTLLSCMVLAFTALQSLMMATFILEVCARAEAIHNVESSNHGLPRRYSMAIRGRSELCRLFLDKRLQIVLPLTFAFDLYGITWAFVFIFGQTMSDNLPMTGRGSDYQYYTLIFAAITIALTCVPIIDQLWIQLFFVGSMDRNGYSHDCDSCCWLCFQRSTVWSADQTGKERSMCRFV